MSFGFLLYYFPGVAFKRSAVPKLQARFGDKASDIWQATRAWQARLAPTRPNHSANVNSLIRHMEWGCALYHALKDHGMDLAEAGPFVETVMAPVYRALPETMFALSRLRSASRRTRVTFLFGLITRYFFSAPFIHRHLPAENGVSFDVTLCPLADYFKDQGMPEITPYAACNLDFCTADAFGITLTRTKTIAQGDDHCDFRWTFPKPRAG